MFYFIKSTVLLNYADDNTLVSCVDNIDDLIHNLSRDSNIAVQWFKDNGMQANPTKFQAILSHRKTRLIQPININNNTVIPQDSVKLLGVTFDVNLTFDTHVDTICRKASRALNVLKRFSKMLSTQN